MVKVIVTGIIFLFAVGSFIISFLQFREKGFLFNNAYLWASAEERKRMNKKPYYRQSSIVFALIGVLFLILALEVLLGSGWLMFAFWLVVLIAVIYAIISSSKTK